jgi:hypothetical protein
MKNPKSLVAAILAMFAAVLLVAAPAAAGNDYSITHWTIAGGGTLEASGGEWRLAGTIGQWEATEARALSGGPWRLTGGFWGFSLEELADFLFQDRFEASTNNNSVELEANS